MSLKLQPTLDSDIKSFKMNKKNKVIFIFIIIFLYRMLHMFFYNIKHIKNIKIKMKESDDEFPRKKKFANK